MVDQLLEVSRRRDYRLKIIFGCRTCALPVHVLLDRTKEEVDSGDRNIKQICYDGHITIPFKQCTYCKTLYRLSDFICIKCEPLIKKITEVELQIEEAKKYDKDESEIGELRVVLDNYKVLREALHAK